MQHNELTLAAVLTIETTTQLAAVATTKGSVKMLMYGTPAATPRFEVQFKKGDTQALSPYSVDELDEAVDSFNEYAALL